MAGANCPAVVEGFVRFATALYLFFLPLLLRGFVQSCADAATLARSNAIRRLKVSRYQALNVDTLLVMYLTKSTLRIPPNILSSLWDTYSRWHRIKQG